MSGSKKRSEPGKHITRSPVKAPDPLWLKRNGPPLKLLKRGSWEWVDIS